MKNDLDRLPPHSLEAEQGVIGCCLTDAGAVAECIERIRSPLVFYDLRHQRIYTQLVALHEAGSAIDQITVQAALQASGDLEKIGGNAYLADCQDAIPSAANLPYYLEIILEKYHLRQLLKIYAETCARIYEPQTEAAAVLDAAERDILTLNQSRVRAREMAIKEVILRTIEQIEDYHRGGAQMRGLSSGFEYLDKMTCGFAPGQLIVIAARPGMGKTSIGMNIVEHVGVDVKLPVAVFSLEMNSEELGARLMFQRSHADFQRFRTGYMLNEDVPKLSLAGAQIAQSKLWIDDSADVNVLELRARARRLHRQHGVKLVLVDYLQLIRGANRYNNREAEVADISRSLKALAKELEIPVIVLAQLNRDLEKERSRMPRLSDLRESGSIEQDADLVAMLYEPRVSEEEEENPPDWSQHSRRINLLIAKQRNGPTGNVELLFHKASMRFHNYIREKS
jgi:replicative DNA helicase